MNQRLLVGIGVVFMLLCISSVSAAPTMEVSNNTIQDVITRSHVNDGGPGSGPVTADDGRGAVKPTITFPSDTTGIRDQSRQAGPQASSNASAKATPSPNSTAPRTAGAIVPLSLGALALVIALRRSR